MIHDGTRISEYVNQTKRDEDIVNDKLTKFSFLILKGDLEVISHFLSEIQSLAREKFLRINFKLFTERLYRCLILSIDPQNYSELFGEFVIRVFWEIINRNFYFSFGSEEAMVYYKKMRYMIFLETFHSVVEDITSNKEQRKEFDGRLMEKISDSVYCFEGVGEEDKYFREEIERERAHDFVSERSYVLLTHKLSKIKKIGYIISVSNEASCNINFFYNDDNESLLNLHEDNNFKIRKIGNFSCYEIQAESLFQITSKRFNLNISNNLETFIFGTYTEKLKKNQNYTHFIKLASKTPCFLFEENEFEVEKYINPQMTRNQFNIVKSSMLNTLTLVHGPPGTGKTAVASEIIRLWLIQRRDLKVLATADSNEAANNLYEEMRDKNIKVCRYSKGLRYKNIYFSNFDVFVITNIGSITDFLQFQFKRVVIDESTQSTETSTLVPLLKKCEQLVLIGDYKQLPPTVQSSMAIKEGFNISLFERLVNCGIDQFLLDVQFRMHPSISEFPNQTYYQGLIRNSPSTLNRKLISGFKWPNKQFNVAFVNVPSCETFVDQRKSYCNLKEIEVIFKIIANINKNGFNKKISVGIITPYSSQKMILNSEIEENLNNQFSNYITELSYQIDTVDGFQGQEKDLIIFSAVRGNKQSKIGFTGDHRRFNVALTRAKRGMIVVGNYETFKINETWREWFEWVDKHKLRIEFDNI